MLKLMLHAEIEIVLVVLFEFLVFCEISLFKLCCDPVSNQQPASAPDTTSVQFCSILDFRRNLELLASRLRDETNNYLCAGCWLEDESFILEITSFPRWKHRKIRLKPFKRKRLLNFPSRAQFFTFQSP